MNKSYQWQNKVNQEKDLVHRRLKSLYPKIFVEMDLEPSSKHQSYTNNSMNTGLCWVGGKG